MRPTFEPTRIFFTILSLLWVCSFVNAQEITRKQKLRISASGGYDREALTWSIGGTFNGGDYVNILSELRWKKIETVNASVSAAYDYWRSLFVQGSFEKGFIINGTVSDTDFAEDNRRDTTFHDNFNSNEGYTTALDVSTGYHFMLSNRFSMTPHIGYSRSVQSLYMLRDFGSPQADLRSTYETKWTGALMGLDASLLIGRRFKVTQQLSYHRIRYRAVANWNLIEEFEHPVSFAHRAKGLGIRNELQLGFLVNEQISFFVSNTFEYWKTGKGIDTLYLQNGDTNVTRLNEVKRTRLAIEIGMVLKLLWALSL